MQPTCLNLPKKNTWYRVLFESASCGINDVCLILLSSQRIQPDDFSTAAIAKIICRLYLLLYIELTISFLIGRKRTVNFRNQRLGNHVIYDRGAWFHVKFAHFVLLAVSEKAKTWLPGSLRWTSRASKKQLKTRTWKRKNWGNLRKRKSWHKLLKHTFYVEARKKEFVQCIIKQLLDSVFVVSRIIKDSVRVIRRSRIVW